MTTLRDFFHWPADLPISQKAQSQFLSVFDRYPWREANLLDLPVKAISPRDPGVERLRCRMQVDDMLVRYSNLPASDYIGVQVDDFAWGIAELLDAKHGGLTPNMELTITGNPRIMNMGLDPTNGCSYTIVMDWGVMATATTESPDFIDLNITSIGMTRSGGGFSTEEQKPVPYGDQPYLFKKKFNLDDLLKEEPKPCTCGRGGQDGPQHMTSCDCWRAGS